MILYTVGRKAIAVKGNKRTDKVAERLGILYLKSIGYNSIEHARKSIENFDERYKNSLKRFKRDSIVGELEILPNEKYNFRYSNGAHIGHNLNNLYLEEV